jgi:hypothetical protein
MPIRCPAYSRAGVEVSGGRQALQRGTSSKVLYDDTACRRGHPPRVYRIATFAECRDESGHEGISGSRTVDHRRGRMR